MPSASALKADQATEAYPNPLRDRTRFTFSLAQDADVRLAVYDVQGREVAVLADGRLAAGAHEATFEAGALPAGVYLWRLSTGDRTETGRLTVVR